MKPHDLPLPDHAVLDDEDCIVAEGDMADFLADTLAAAHHTRLFEHLMACHLCLQSLLECMAEDARGDDARVALRSPIRTAGNIRYVPIASKATLSGVPDSHLMISDSGRLLGISLSRRSQ